MTANIVSGEGYGKWIAEWSKSVFCHDLCSLCNAASMGKQTCKGGT